MSTPLANARKFKIYSVKSGLPIAVPGASMEPGPQIIQWSDENNDHFKWIFQDIGKGYFKIYSVKSGLPIAVSGASMEQGGKVIQWSDENNDHFKWLLAPCVSLGQQGYFKIYSVKSGLPIAVSGASMERDGKVIQWSDENNDHFKWRLVEVS